MDDISAGQILVYLVLLVVLIFVITALVKAVRIVPQAVALVVERLGRYHKTLEPGLRILVPFIDKVRAGVDLREQVVSFPPQPVITSDNLVVSIDTVIYFQVTDPKSAVYEIANYITGIEQLTVTTLRNVVGSMDLEQTLTSRDQINGQLRGVLDEATGKWGVRVSRVELKSIDPPASVQGSMEQQMRAERDRRAAILTAEGVKQSQILTAEGEKQSAILRAEGDAQARVLRAEGEARAILQVFDAIHTGDADPKLLAYQYLQMLPQVANGTASKLWVVPAEFTAALGSIGKAFGGGSSQDGPAPAPSAEESAATRALRQARLADVPVTLADAGEALREAQRQSEAATADATAHGTRSGVPFDPSHTVGQAPGELAPAPTQYPPTPAPDQYPPTPAPTQYPPAPPQA
jgi:regulator of protease activity HflC (stomatin/prohibitin superfamily)